MDDDDPRARDSGGVPAGPPTRIRLTNANNAAFLGVTLAFGAVALALALGWFGEWREPDCSGYPVQSVASPSGAWRAVQEQQACASTDELRTTVVVRPEGASSGPVVFEARSGNALGVLSVGQRSLPLDLEWKSERELLIRHPANLALRPAADNAAGVRVTLSARQPPAAR